MHAKQMGRCLASSLVIWLAIAMNLQAQDESDLLRFTEWGIPGTARSQGMAGAMTAFGADFSSTAINPAGLGFYRRDELSITPSLQMPTNRAEYLGRSNSSTRTNFGFQSLGFVFSSPIWRSREAGIARDKGLKSFAIAFGFNQVANFHRQIAAQGYNPLNTIGDFFVGITNGTRVPATPQGSIWFNNLYSNLAWRSYVIDTLADTNNFYRPIAAGANVQQGYTLTEQGRTNQWSIAAGFNISDRVYVGVALNVMDYVYRANLAYTEEDIRLPRGPGNIVQGFYEGIANGAGFQRMNFNQDFGFSGLGFNARFGVIVQPIDELRVGFSVQTPSIASLQNTLSASMYMYQWNGAQNPPNRNSLGQLVAPNAYELEPLNVTMNTPWRLNAGVAYFLPNKLGVVTADVEMTQPASGRLQANVSGRNILDFANQNAQQQFQTTYGLRLGTELKYQNLYGRLGFAYWTSALKNGAQEYGDIVSYNRNTGTYDNRSQQQNRTALTTGLGFRTRKFYFDVAYVFMRSFDRITAYPVPEEIVSKDSMTNQFITVPFSVGTDLGGLGAGIAPVIVNEKNLHNVALTLGFVLGS